MGLKKGQMQLRSSAGKKLVVKNTVGAISGNLKSPDTHNLIFQLF